MTNSIGLFWKKSFASVDLAKVLLGLLTYSILINGSQWDSFQPLCGLRQGAHFLHSFLFTAPKLFLGISKQRGRTKFLKELKLEGAHGFYICSLLMIIIFISTVTLSYAQPSKIFFKSISISKLISTNQEFTEIGPIFKNNCSIISYKF